MYFESQSNNRESWKFHYEGGQLWKSARTLFLEFKEKEMAARTKVADLMRDDKVSHSDDRIQEAKKDIQKYGREAEACSVWIHEFARNPEREYVLSLGDVVYFRLASDNPISTTDHPESTLREQK